MASFSKTFDLILEGIIKIIYYERLDFQSVYIDEKRRKKRIQEVKG